tara:strand:+ start:55 stop:276 length:222 start_codon:yes stop_codon:yes gene_type:complete
MRKAFAIMFIVLGCLFGAISLWSGSGLLTDTTTTDTVIADVTDNLDIKRIDEPSQRDFERLKKYRRALKVLQT